MRLDVTRTGRTVVLIAWSVFFVWLITSGQLTRYFGPRTFWVAPVGALLLAAAAAASVRGMVRHRSEAEAGMTLRGAMSLVVLLAPLAAALAAPDASLGSFAASQRATAGALGGAAYGVPEKAAPGEVKFREISFASNYAGYATASRIGPGLELSLTGFVTQLPGESSRKIGLTRFYISCCAADAIPFTVPVVLPAGVQPPPVDSWLSVSGTLEDDDGSFRLDGLSVKRIPSPSDPYLY